MFQCLNGIRSDSDVDQLLVTGWALREGFQCLNGIRSDSDSVGARLMPHVKTRFNA